MESVLYSWLGVGAVAPFVGLLSAWTLIVFFNYRSRWRLPDVFLCSLTAHEIVFSLFAFGFAVLSIIRPLFDTPCSFMVWGLTASRLFHLSALTSLLLDRALSSKFPYTYRYSVSKSQVQYHLTVLGIIAVFIGVTSAFARAPTATAGVCSLHPLAWNSKFSVFLSSIYGVLLLTGFVCCFAVALRRKNRGEKHGNWESGRSSTSTSSSNALKEDWQEQRDDEWKTVASICWLSYIINHGPYLAMTIMGIVVPAFWSPWLDNVTIWMSLAQGILVPLMLLVADVPHRSAVKGLLSQPGRIYRHLSDHSGFQLQVPGSAQYTLHNVTPPPPPMMACSSNCLPVHNVFQVPHRMRWTQAKMPSLQSLNLDNQQTPAFFCTSNGTFSKVTSRCVSPLPPLGRDSISTLGSNYTLLTAQSSISKTSSDHSDEVKPDIEDDTMSITTNALDDFEFHGGQEEEEENRQEDAHIDNEANNNIDDDKIYNSIIDDFESDREQTTKKLNRESNFDASNKNQVPKNVSKTSFNFNHCSTKDIPNFGSNNLIFLSPKPLHERCISFRESTGQNCVVINTVSKSLEPCTSYMREGGHKGFGISNKIPTSNVTLLNEQDSFHVDTLNKRLVIYSEYL